MVAVTLGTKHLVATRYAVERLLGEGGSSVVWQARDTASGDIVALKCLKRAADGSFLLSRERFVAEAALLRDFDHPNIVPVLDVGEEEDGTPYFVMPYLGDQTLATLLCDGPLSLETALQLLLPIADALSYLHARGVIHRDLKPENVSIVEDADGKQRALLLDFGVAKFDGPSMTQSGLVVGTPLYMAPEQALSKAITSRTDVWGLASVLYTCVSGTSPFSGANATQVLLRIVSERAAPLSTRNQDVPFAVARVVDRALSTDPALRYASIEAFVRALDDAWSRSRAAFAKEVAPRPTDGRNPRLAGGYASASTPTTEAPSLAVPSIQVIPWQDIFAVVDDGRGQPDEYRILHDLVTLQAKCFPDGIGCLAIIPQSAKPPSEPVRQALASALQAAQGSLRCLCWLVEGTGFQGGMIRSVLVGLRLVTRRAYATHIATDLDEALTWMLANLSNGMNRQADIARARAEIERRRKVVR